MVSRYLNLQLGYMRGYCNVMADCRYFTGYCLVGQSHDVAGEMNGVNDVV